MSENINIKLPELLAPAGDISSFLSGLAAGADATYVGLKNFSARAGAENFGFVELAQMVELAEKYNRKIYVAFNSLLKSTDLVSAAHIIRRLQRDIHPHALIIQDLGMIDLIRQAGYEGDIHVSTLANVTQPFDLLAAQRMGVQRVVIPRELSIDEIRLMDAQAPENMDFEMFIHGALCWCVSGRCYWSSYLGGKSGLRGRCVQPCRRIYNQKGREGRFFSCQDLSLDVLIKTLVSLPHVRSLKIEGRKKGPHYVYHVVSAYRMLLDSLGTSDWPQAKKDAEQLLQMSLGRPLTHGRFLPQKTITISTPNDPTSSGMLIGKIHFDKQTGPQPIVTPRIPLLPKDLLRIGYEDDRWHDTIPLTRAVPKGGSCVLKVAKSRMPVTGVPVFLIDRREKDLISVLSEKKKELEQCRKIQSPAVTWSPVLPKPAPFHRMQDYLVRSSLPSGKETRPSRSRLTALWMSLKSVRSVSKTILPRISWWLPPVIWADSAESWIKIIHEAVRGGSTNFVLNSPWQISLFDKYENLCLVAGPFCNIANPAAVSTLAKLGFKAAFVSPELSSSEFLALPKQSCLPLGIVVSGYFPVGISRNELNVVHANEVFYSPKKEPFWSRSYGGTSWIYPAWPLDLSAHLPELESAGYAFFAKLEENLPSDFPQVKRISEFNWDNTLL